MENYAIFEKIEKYFFTFLSLILHPIFIPLYTLYLIILIHSQYFYFNEKSVLMLLFIFSVLTIIIPLFIVSLMFYLKMITSFHLTTKNERLSVSFILLMFYFFTIFVLRTIHFPYLIQLYFYALPSILTILLITQWLYYKLSLHLYGMGSVIGILLYFRLEMDVISPFYLLFIIILATGLITTARLILKSHTFKEVNLGFFLGIVASYLSLLGLSSILS